MITASALPRLMNCLASSALPRAENASEWADAGHQEHAELADQLLHGDLPEWIAAVVPAGSRPELALAYDVVTRKGRIIGENLGRNYRDIGPFEIAGASDVVGVEGDSVVVVDFKTGHNDVEPAATNAQLAFYALAAASALGKDTAIVRIVYTKSRRVDEATLDVFDLAAFAEQLSKLHVGAAEMHAAYRRGEQLETREGSWCKHCASKPYCPSKNALLVQVAEKGLAVIGDSTLTPERAAAGYEQLVKVEQLVKEARKRLETYVEEIGPIDLGGGRMFGRYVRPGNERLDGTVAVQAIAEIVGESAKEFEAVAVERRTSKAAIDRAAKQFGSKRGTAPAVIRRIRELGGATNAPDTLPIGEYLADKHEPAEKPEIDADAINQLMEAV